MSTLSFNGTAEQQALAAEIFRLMVAQGALFADDAPIKQTLTNLADFLATQRQRDRDMVVKEIESAVCENQQIFTREERNGEVLYVTSRLGAYKPHQEDMRHTFKERLYEPDHPLPIDDISVVVSTSRPALTTVEPVLISDYWQRQAGLLPTGEVGAESEVILQPQIDEPIPIARKVEEVLVTPVTAELITPEAREELAPPQPEEVKEAPAPVEVLTAKQVFKLPDETPIDISLPVADIMSSHREALEAALLNALESDPLRRLVVFGRLLYAEAGLVSLGKNDMRRIRDYIVEVGEPLLDTAIIADLYYHNPRQTDYEGFRFSLNYRLSREKDFEFVGVEGARLWSTRGIAPIGTKRIKASEMGQLTAYLTEGYDDSLEFQSAASIMQSGILNHLLTFFEWEYGILPLDESLTTLLPQPLLANQRSAVLRIEAPQHYTNYLVELRYPTGNRGGWLQGLEEFFREHLVPGAIITLGRTEEPNVFTITYEEAESVEDRLLTLDEKKNKFSFSNLTYYCAVDTDYVVNQQKFGKLKNVKSLSMSDRRKADVVLAHIFETIGEQVGSRSEPTYWISLDDLVVACNVLRPISRSYISAFLTKNADYTSDSSTPGAYYYKPTPDQIDEENPDTVAHDYYDEDEE